MRQDSAHSHAVRVAQSARGRAPQQEKDCKETPAPHMCPSLTSAPAVNASWEVTQAASANMNLAMALGKEATVLGSLNKRGLRSNPPIRH